VGGVVIYNRAPEAVPDTREILLDELSPVKEEEEENDEGKKEQEKEVVDLK
jgi:hypothetical protein